MGNPCRVRFAASKPGGWAAAFAAAKNAELVVSGAADAVYLLDARREAVLRAAEQRLHVLVEPPASDADAEAMREACRREGIRFLVVDRLRFDAAHRDVVRLAASGKLGALLSLTGNGDSLPSLLRAAQTLFGSEPEEVLARPDESVVTLRFGEAIATLAVAPHMDASYDLVGTEGHVRLDSGEEPSWKATLGGVGRKKRYPRRDPLTAVIDHFAESILEGGPTDDNPVELMRALLQSGE